MVVIMLLLTQKIYINLEHLFYGMYQILHHMAIQLAKTLKSAILYHFDPLTQIETDKLSSFSRYEYYKYLTKNDSINYVNYLNDEEVNDLVLFLETLEFLN